MAINEVEITSGPQAASSGGCACGGHDQGVPELDVRQIPHAIRHATVFGALGAIAPGFALDLVAPHNPLPLLAQIVGIVDVYDALTSQRPYRGALSADEATRHLRKEVEGGRFAKTYVEAFLDTLADVAVPAIH